MSYFDCCRFCEPPKRYPGCSGACGEYKDERKRYDTDMAKKPGRSVTDNYYCQQVIKRKDESIKRGKYGRIHYRGGDCV